MLKVSTTWDSHKLSECLKALFREILLPTYGLSTEKFLGYFKGHLYPALDKCDFTKRSFAHTFENLLFLHAYVHTLFESNSLEEFEMTIQSVLPPLFTLDNILRNCTDVVRIKEACAKESDLPVALTFARLAAYQALKLLWFQVMILIQPTESAPIKKRESSSDP